MPWGVAAAVAGAATSAALAPSPSSGGGGGGGGPSYYVPTGLGAADTDWQNFINQQIASQGQSYNTLPQLYESQALGNQALAQYGPGYQNAANVAGQQYGGIANNLLSVGQNAFDMSSGLAGAGRQAYQTAFDPQSALYNRTVQQLQDQTGATNSMYGLGSSAAGAGVANQALSNFNIDWQNQQLQRQLQGLQGLGTAYGQAGQLAGQGAALQGTGAGYTLQSGQLPYQTAQGIAAYPGQLGATYSNQIQTGPMASANSITSQIIPYLNYGQGAQQVPFQSQQQGAGAAGALVSQGIQGLGSNSQVQSALGNVFGGGTTGSFGGGDFSGAFSSNPYYGGGGNSYGFTMGY